MVFKNHGVFKLNVRLMKKILIGLTLILFFGTGVFLTKKYYTWQEVQAKEQSQVLLEKVKNVYKLVTVEGHFSEVYTYEDYWAYDFSPFRKKALIRVVFCYRIKKNCIILSTSSR